MVPGCDYPYRFPQNRRHGRQQIESAALLAGRGRLCPAGRKIRCGAGAFGCVAGGFSVAVAAVGRLVSVVDLGPRPRSADDGFPLPARAFYQ